MVILKTIQGMGGMINLVDEEQPHHILGVDVRFVRTHYPYEDNRNGRTFDPVVVLVKAKGSVIELVATEDQFVPRGNTVLWFDTKNIASIVDLLGDSEITLKPEYLGAKIILRHKRTKLVIQDNSTSA